MDATSFLLFFVPFLLILAGLGLLWWASARAVQPEGLGDDPLRRVLVPLGWCLGLLGTFAALAITAHVYFLLAWMVAAIVLAAAVRRYFDLEQRTLLWVLMTAAERGIPLPEAAEAFAAERRDSVGRRAALLADYLEAGLPLALALQRSGHRVPSHLLLAAELGERTGTLGPALRRVVGPGDELDRVSRSLLEGFFYLAFLVIFASGMLGFLMVKIVPIFIRILDEFGQTVPNVMRGWIELTRGGPLWLAGLLALILLVLVGLYYYLLRAPRELPLIRWLWWRAEAALVLRWLGLAVGQKRLLGDSLRLLAGYFPRPALRKRLVHAARQVDAGGHWCDSLERAGLVRTREAAVLKAAERTGNLSWAFEQLADSSIRRTAWRVGAGLQVAFPLAVLLIGAAVLLILLCVWTPLVSLIEWLQ